MSRPLPFARTALASAITATFLCAPSIASAPYTGEIPLNVLHPEGSQVGVRVAMDADGDFIAVWENNGFNSGVALRKFTASGSSSSQESIIASGGNRPAVAMAPDGRYVVAWDGAGAGDTQGIYFQLFNAAGSTVAGPTRVNTYTTGIQVYPSVAMDAAGEFVVAWDSQSQDGSNYGVYLQRYSAVGAPLGGETPVNSTTTGTQGQPAVAKDADGDFVVTWHSFQDGSGYGIYARRYSAFGGALSAETRVNTVTTNNQLNPAIAMGADGNFVIAWDSGVQPPDGSSTGVFAQRFTASGAMLGGEFPVNTYTSNAQESPSVAMDADGDFIVAWQSYGQDGSARGVYARRYSAAGVAQTPEFRVNVYANDYQAVPAIAMDADGDAVVAWQSYYQDGERYGVYARRYRGWDPVDLSLTQFDTPDPVAAGAPLSYVLNVTNLRSPVATTGIPSIDAAIGAASAVRVVGSLPPGASVVSLGQEGWDCGIASQVLTCVSEKSLPAGKSLPLTVDLTAPTAGGPVQHSAIVDHLQPDPNLANNSDVEGTAVQCVIQLSAASYSASEAAGSMLVTASRTGSGCPAASVQYDAANGSALAGLDYTDLTGTLSWAAGDTADKSFSLPVLDDSLDENDEKVLVSLGQPVGAQLGARSKASAVITDDDAAPRINFTTTQQSAAEPGALATVTVQLSEISGRNVTVNLNRSGTATFNSDYFAPGKLTLPAGVRSVSFDVEVADDAADEDPEFVTLALANPIGATLGTLGTHKVNIGDDDSSAGLPTVTFNKPTDTGTEAQARSVIATLSEASALTVTVPFTVSGTATAGSDFTVNKTSPLSFAPGVTSITVTVYGVDDAIAGEGSETAILTLGTPTNAALGAVTVFTRTITDND